MTHTRRCGPGLSIGESYRFVSRQSGIAIKTVAGSFRQRPDANAEREFKG